MNTLKKIGLTCLVAIIGWGTATAATHTVTFTGCNNATSLNFTETPTGTTAWSGSNAKKWLTSSMGDLRIEFHQSASYGYLNCNQYPNTWRVTGVKIVSDSYDLNTVEITVNGVSFTKSTKLEATGSAEPQATNTANSISIKFGGGTDKYIEIKQIIITYESVSAAPVLKYTSNYELGSNDTDPHLYPTIPAQENVYSDQPLYTKDGTKLTSALSSGLFALWDATDYTEIPNAITSVIINDDANIFTVYFDQSKLTNCHTYILVATAPYNEHGVAAVGSSLQWYFSTPTITASDLNISGTTTFLAGSTFDHSDWVITKGGTDITALCTNFSNPNMTTDVTKDVDVTFDYAGCTIKTKITVKARNTYTLTWKNLVTGEADKTTQVQEGNTVGTLPTPAQTTISTNCGEKRFVGWTTTEIVGSQDEAPTLVQSTAIPTANRTLYAVYADATGSSGDTWEQITSAAQLQAGKTYLIGNTDGSAVMGAAASSNNNFTQVTATNSDNIITPASGYNAVVLGGSTGAWTLQLAGNDQYLYAASSTANQLKSRAGNDDGNSQWDIIIAADGSATVTAQGSYTRNNLRYNTSSKLFSCYSTGQQAVSFYINTGGGTGFITKCTCTPLSTPTGLVAQNADGSSVELSWTAVAGATSYLVEYSINDGATWSSVECSGTPYKLTGLNKSTKYTWRIVALSNDGTHCVKSEASATSTFTTTSNCAWQINYEQTVGGTWSQANCFSQVSSTEWQLADFTLPNSNCNFWVGPGTWGAHSKTVQFKDGLTFAGLQNTYCSKPYPGEKAVGTLRIYSDSGADNYFVGFMPTYQIAYGLQGSTWVHLPFAYVSDHDYETALTEAPSGYWDNPNYQFYVGAKNADGGTNWINGKSNTVAMQTMGGLSAKDISGAKGVYHIYDHWCNDNWNCEFIPYYNIVYYADNTTVYQTSDYISSKKSDAERTINVLSNGPAKEGYRFIGWSRNYGSATTDVLPGGSYTLQQCNEPLYPVYIQQVTLSYNTNGGVSICEATTIDINTATTVCADAPTRDGYKFNGWTTAKDGTGTKYAPGESITLSASVTLYAQWLPYIKAYYDKTNINFAGDCDASEKLVVQGDVITLCGAPTSPFGYEFQNWAINGNDYAAGATYTVSGAELEIKITPVWKTPMHEFIFINQGAGTSQEVIISTVSGAEGAYITAPASCGTVPTNCEGKVFVGWLRGTYDGTLDGNEGVNNPEQLIEKATEQGSTGVFFASPGERVKVGSQSDSASQNWGKWYAVFAVPE